jgi:hypothetical protein
MLIIYILKTVLNIPSTFDCKTLILSCLIKMIQHYFYYDTSEKRLTLQIMYEVFLLD